MVPHEANADFAWHYRGFSLDRQGAAESWLNSVPKPRKRLGVHCPDAESIDETTHKESNHPKIDGFYPFSPLNPHHPRADGDALAAGFKNQSPFSSNRDYATSSFSRPELSP